MVGRKAIRGTRSAFKSPFSYVVQRADQFVANFRRGDHPTNWMHILYADRANGWTTAFAQCFACPRGLPVAYQVQVGSDPSRIQDATPGATHR